MSEEKTFRDAYATLQKHAQTLRSQQEPDIDNLTTIVSESVEAYKVCKQRIDAVEKARRFRSVERGRDTKNPDSGLGRKLRDVGRRHVVR